MGEFLWRHWNRTLPSKNEMFTHFFLLTLQNTYVHNATQRFSFVVVVSYSKHKSQLLHTISLKTYILTCMQLLIVCALRFYKKLISRKSQQ